TGVPQTFAWALPALPIALAAITYVLVQGIWGELIRPLVTRRPRHAQWGSRLLRGASIYLLGAAAAAGVALLLERQLWNFAPVVTVALVLAYRAYADHVRRLHEEI